MYFFHLQTLLFKAIALHSMYSLHFISSFPGIRTRDLGISKAIHVLSGPQKNFAVVKYQVDSFQIVRIAFLKFPFNKISIE